MDRSDVVVLGGGSGGEAVARAAASGGRSVAVVERWLVGGECPFTACMPSKAVLHVAGAGGSWADAVAHREEIVKQRDDSGHVADLEERGVRVVRGEGRVLGPGRLVVSDAGAQHELGFTDLVVATGAGVHVPPFPGLGTVEHWTFEDVWTTTELPASIVVVGGGATALEAATALAAFGTAVTLLVRGDLLVREAPELEDVVVDGLRARGVDVRRATEVARFAPGDGGGIETVLQDGSSVVAERLLLATGKRARLAGLGLEHVGVDPEAFVVGRDGRVAGAEGVWAVGDVTGFPAFTHTANHLAGVLAQNLLDGGAREVDLDHTPRGVFTDPPHVLVGDLAPDVPHVRVTASYADGARPLTDATGPGALVLTAARGDGRVLGVAGAGASVDELASAWTLMVAAGLSVHLVARVQQQFPSHGELTKLLAERAVAALEG